MAHFSFIITEGDGDARRDELTGEYPNSSDAIEEAKRFLFDFGRDVLTRDSRSSVRIEVRTTAGDLVFDANLDYAARTAEGPAHASDGGTGTASGQL